MTFIVGHKINVGKKRPDLKGRPSWNRGFDSRISKNCLKCNKSFLIYPSESRIKYCSQNCVPKGLNKAENNGMWKGEDVGYKGLHQWVSRNLGKPSKCERCGTINAKRFEWANRSRKYLRDLSDWIRLCKSCHQYCDANKIKLTR